MSKVDTLELVRGTLRSIKAKCASDKPFPRAHVIEQIDIVLMHLNEESAANILRMLFKKSESEKS
jgi:hypothetical protein